MIFPPATWVTWFVLGMHVTSSCTVYIYVCLLYVLEPSRSARSYTSAN